MANGQLVTSETVVSLLKEKIGSKGGKFMVDGFPKSFENLDQWNKSMLYNCNLGPTLLLECDEEVVFQRSKAANGRQGTFEEIDYFQNSNPKTHSWFRETRKSQKNQRHRLELRIGL